MSNNVVIRYIHDDGDDHNWFTEHDPKYGFCWTGIKEMAKVINLDSDQEELLELISDLLDNEYLPLMIERV